MTMTTIMITLITTTITIISTILKTIMMKKPSNQPPSKINISVNSVFCYLFKMLLAAVMSMKLF